MNDLNLLIAGFGGQGILFMGKVMAYIGLIEEKQVSWLPSYGPEMRGGTSNCSICISEDPICSPLVTDPNALIVMNGPSFDKFIDTVVPGGKIFIESTLVDRKVERTDIEAYFIPAQKIAEEKELKGLENMIILGKMIAVTGCCSKEALQKAMEKIVSPKRQHLIPKNIEALEVGMNYNG